VVNEAQGGLPTAFCGARVWASNHSESAAKSELFSSTALLTWTTSLPEASTFPLVRTWISAAPAANPVRLLPSLKGLVRMTFSISN